MEQSQEVKKRGYLFDAILEIGQIEAGMEHGDEQVGNLWHDMEQNSGDPEKLQRMADELQTNRELMAIDYEDRVGLQNFVFDNIPDSNKHYWCRVKHAAFCFAKAAENYHASRLDPQMEQHLVRACKRLALACSLAFGMDMMDCLRCVSDSLATRDLEAKAIVTVVK